MIPALFEGTEVPERAQQPEPYGLVGSSHHDEGLELPDRRRLWLFE
jgi:hypothetical protein